MAIKVGSTKDFGFDGVKILVHSPAGVGKTVLAMTGEEPLIISAEAGLMSLADYDIPAIEVTTVEQVDECYRYVTEAEEGKKKRTICLDSVTDMADRMLSVYKAKYADPRQAYGQLFDDMSTSIRKFRDLKGRHVYFTARQQRMVVDGVTKYLPGMPGQALLNWLPFQFDMVFALKIGMIEGMTYRYLQTYPDINYDCKCRGGKLPPRSKPDLKWCFDRIAGIVNEPVTTLTTEEIIEDQTLTEPEVIVVEEVSDETQTTEKEDV